MPPGVPGPRKGGHRGMDGDLAVGLVLVLAAGLLQGTFMLPMTLTRGWRWEHSWALFSLLGMLLFNWAVAGWAIPGLIDAYRDAPGGDLAMLALFGLLWGAGAILFGLGMDRLGMALGYPIIMGLILSLGAILPLLLQDPRQISSRGGLLLLLGMAVTIGGILQCSRAAAAKGSRPGEGHRASLGAGLVIAVLAGTFSCLPNVGMNHAESLQAAAVRHGATEGMARNAAWAILFTSGFTVNFAYCLWVMLRRGNVRDSVHEPGRNAGLIAIMAACWIGSFYLYGMGAARLGKWGGIIGWPLFISLAILVGNLWGLWRGEWRGADPRARAGLNRGLVVLILAMAIFGLAGAVR
jgi:L-rhamnose-H+ transport protein